MRGPSLIGSRRRPLVGLARGSRERALGLLVAAAVAACGPSTVLASTPAGLQVELRGDRLTVRARQVPLEDALAAIASRLGAEVLGHVAAARTVDVEFEDVALPDGLARLLGRESFALVYGGTGSVRRIHLLGGPHDTGAAPAADVASAATAPPASTASLQPPPRRLGRARPVMARTHPVHGPSLPHGPQAQAAHQRAARQAMLRAIIADRASMGSLQAPGESLEGFLARIGTGGTSEGVRANAAAALDNVRRAWVVVKEPGVQP